MAWISRINRIMPAVAVIVVLLIGTEVDAGKRRGLCWRPRPHPQSIAPSYSETYRWLNARYPKYYGGFHSSYFENMGIPPADIGLRTNGIYQTPW